MADFLFRKDEMSAPDINTLLNAWALSMQKHDDLGPFDNYKHIYEAIDDTKLGDAPWQCLSVDVDPNLPEDAPSWKKKSHKVYFRDPDTVLANMLDNPDFDGEFDKSAYVEIDANGKRRWSDYMSANSAWRRSVCSFFPFLAMLSY